MSGVRTTSGRVYYSRDSIAQPVKKVGWSRHTPFKRSPKTPLQESNKITDNEKEQTLGSSEMSQSYSKDETDLKFELVEERFDHKLDKVLSKIDEGFLKVENRFNLLDEKINHVDKLVWWVFVTLGAILLGAAIKYILIAPH